MDWNGIFRSRHVVWLERELLEMVRRHMVAMLELNKKHEEEISRIESLNQTIQFEAMRERTELKKAHAEELSRVIQENKKLWDELTKVRYVETPALRQVQVNSEKDDSAPPSPRLEAPVGTPWQRVQKFYAEQEERAAKVRFTKPAGTPVEGETHGNDSDGRQSTPLGEPSKVA